MLSNILKVLNQIKGKALNMTEGCSHYQRSIMIRAECCQKWFSCHVCHNEQSNHEIDKKLVSMIKCNKCDLEQLLSEKCNNKNCSASEKFAFYCCMACKIYNNDSKKEIYHCDECGICRKGNRSAYFHCKTCNMCISIALLNNHKCLPNKFDKDCPVCRENLFTCRSPAINFKNCPHSMCENCYTEYVKTSYVCPICKKSLSDLTAMWTHIDSIIEDHKMPEEYNNHTVDIGCNDCNKESPKIKYHFMYHKCQHCGSYNTNILRTFKP